MKSIRSALALASLALLLWGLAGVISPLPGPQPMDPAAPAQVAAPRDELGEVATSPVRAAEPSATEVPVSGDATVRFLFVDPEGVGVPGIEVALLRSDIPARQVPGDRAAHGGSSDPGGRVDLEGLAPGRYGYRVLTHGQLYSEREGVLEVEEGATVVRRVTVGARTVVVGRVPSLGAPVERVHLRLLRESDDGAELREDIVGGVLAAEDGTFEIPARPGPSHLSAFWIEEGPLLLVAERSGIEVVEGRNEVGLLSVEPNQLVVEPRFVLGGEVVSRAEVFEPGGIEAVLQLTFTGSESEYFQFVRVPLEETLVLQGLRPGNWFLRLSEPGGAPLKDGLLLASTPGLRVDVPVEHPVHYELPVRSPVATDLTLVWGGEEFLGLLALGPVEGGGGAVAVSGSVPVHGVRSGRRNRVPVERGLHAYLVRPAVQEDGRRVNAFAMGELAVTGGAQVIVLEEGVTLHGEAAPGSLVTASIEGWPEPFPYATRALPSGSWELTGVPLGVTVRCLGAELYTGSSPGARLRVAEDPERAGARAQTPR